MNDFPTSNQQPSELHPTEPTPSELKPSDLKSSEPQPPETQASVPGNFEPQIDAVNASGSIVPAVEVNSLPAAPPAAIEADAAVTSPGGSSFNTRHFLTPFIAVAAWIVPGLGHLLVGRWGRALLIFIAVAGLALTGFYARGQVFPPHSDDPFGTLGFLADACSGVFFVIAHLVERAGPDVSRAAGDYGTRFVAAAGLVNLLAVLDACGIALGRRN